jgi:UDP-N-acetyl-D-mannosaminuronic acid transferase (WecB/TagA/CpsF family)
MKIKRILIKSLFSLIGFILINSFSFAQKPNQKELPSITFSASKNIVVLDDSKENLNVVKLDSKFNSLGTKELPNSTLWEISGTQGKDWEIISGTKTSKTIQIKFKKVGSFNVSISIGYTYKNNKGADEEDEATYDQDNYITVTNNLDELTQIHADSNFIKLVKRAEDFKVKPKYAGDPTPLIFLAKGYYGMYRKELQDPLITDPYDQAIISTAEAIEMDQNGIFNMPIHKMWLTNFQMEILDNGITFNLDSQEGHPIFSISKDAAKNAQTNEEIKEAIEQYKSITKNSVSCNLLEAAIRYHIKDPKGANIIFATAIPNLLKLKNIEEFTEPDIKALKLGVILSAQILSKRDGGNSNACKILDKASIWFEGDQEFVSLYEEKFNSCKTD